LPLKDNICYYRIGPREREETRGLAIGGILPACDISLSVSSKPKVPNLLLLLLGDNNKLKLNEKFPLRLLAKEQKHLR